MCVMDLHIYIDDMDGAGSNGAGSDDDDDDDMDNETPLRVGTKYILVLFHVCFSNYLLLACIYVVFWVICALIAWRNFHTSSSTLFFTSSSSLMHRWRRRSTHAGWKRPWSCIKSHSPTIKWTRTSRSAWYVLTPVLFLFVCDLYYLLCTCAFTCWVIFYCLHWCTDEGEVRLMQDGSDHGHASSLTVPPSSEHAPQHAHGMYWPPVLFHVCDLFLCIFVHAHVESFSSSSLMHSWRRSCTTHAGWRQWLIKSHKPTCIKWACTSTSAWYVLSPISLELSLPFCFVCLLHTYDMFTLFRDAFELPSNINVIFCMQCNDVHAFTWLLDSWAGYL